MRSALVVNCSAKYNLGAAKLADWLTEQGYCVTREAGDPGMFSDGYDLVCLSCIFSWDVLLARDVANRVKADSEVWAGGPGFTAMRKWWQRETGLECAVGIDARFDRQRGAYKMAFASRGCPVGCWFCVVPLIEGKTFTLDWDFQPAPFLCDNNLSALPVEFQEHVIQRYQKAGTPLKDANSGFEPRSFDGGTYARWQDILAGPWRFAYDDLNETTEVRTMMRLLRDVPRTKKRVYVLIGNEPMSACFERAQSVIEWGGEPYCQPVLPLNALSREDFILRYDWTPQRLHDFTRYYNRWLWRSVPISEYAPRMAEDPPFARCLK